MGRFVYKEDKKSFNTAKRKYYHFLMFLYKKVFLCGDSLIRKDTIKRIKALKNAFKENNYPEYVKAHPDTRLAVYTVLFGNYDNIKPVKFISENCDYFIITDQDVDENSGWKKLEYEFPESLKDADNAAKNRYLKMQPEVLFHDYEYSLYLDATMQPVCDLFPFLARMGEHFIGMFHHETRNCIYKEAEVVKRIGKAKPDEVDSLVSKYKKEGFPENFGLTAGGIILRRHNSPECKKIMDMWWDMYKNGPKRDQLSLMYCMWKCGYTINDFGDLGIEYGLEPRLDSEKHK